MRRLGTLARRASLLAALLLLCALVETPGRAQDATNVAGLVVVDEDGGVGYALVTFDEAEISGIELLRRSGAEPVTVSFGGLGEGVCGIGETGCAVDVCRQRLCQTGAPDSPYWQSFAAGDDGTWATLQLGATADRVVDGDVRLWAWTAEEPSLPLATVNDISQEVDGDRNAIRWQGVSGDDDSGAPLWIGIALIGVVGGAAGLMTVRARARAG